MSKATKNTIYRLAVILPIIAAAVLVFKMDAIAEGDYILHSAGSQWPSVINQALFILALEAFGLLLMMCFRKHFSRYMIVMLSFIVGVLAWCLSSVVIVAIGIRFTWYYTALLCLGFLAAAYFVSKPKMPDKEELAFYGKALLLYVSIALVFAALCVFRFSYDSYMYINTGQKIATLGYIPKELVSVVSGFSLFTPMLFAPSVFFGYDFSQGVYILLNAQFSVFVGYAVYEGLKEKLEPKKAFWAGVFAFFALVSSNIYFELTYWPMSNLLTTMTMFGMLYFSWRAQEEKESVNMIFSAFFAICFVLTRSENMLLYICFMFILSLTDIKKRSLALHVGAVALALILWYVRFFAVAGLDFTEGAFLTADKAAAVLGVMILFIAYILFLSGAAFICRRRKLIERLFFAAMAVAVAGLAFLKPDFFIENAKVTAANIFFDGGWGGALMVFALMYVIKLAVVPGVDYFDRQALVFIFFFIIIFLLRSMPLRVGYGDSGSRYFAHILPLLIYNISLSLGKKI